MAGARSRPEALRFPLLLTLSFARHLRPERIRRFIAEHRAAHAAAVELRGDACGDPPEAREADPHGLAALDFGLTYRGPMLTWFERLRERPGRPPRRRTGWRMVAPRSSQPLMPPSDEPQLLARVPRRRSPRLPRGVRRRPAVSQRGSPVAVSTPPLGHGQEGDVARKGTRGPCRDCRLTVRSSRRGRHRVGPGWPARAHAGRRRADIESDQWTASTKNTGMMLILPRK